MKKIVLSTLVALVFTTVSSCSGKKTETQNEQNQSVEQYQCPMKCTEEIFDKAGKCPVCEMDLEKISNS